MPRRKRRTKAPHGEGSVWPRKDGRFGWAIGSRTDGSQVTGTKATEAEAHAALARVKAAAAQLTKDQERQTVKDFLEEWLAVIVKPHKSANTYKTYEQIVRLHIIPEIGERRLSSITRTDLQILINAARAKESKNETPYSFETVKKVQAIFQLAWGTAQTWGRVDGETNPATKLQLPKKSKRRMNPYTEEEAGRFIRAAREDPYGLAVILAVLTGLRKTELLNLTTADIDWEEGTVHAKGTKSERSHRRVDFPSELAPLLRRHVEELERWRQIEGERWKAGDRLFVSEQLRPVSSTTLHRHFFRIIDTAGLRRIRFHELRHTYATLLLAKGIPIQVVSRNLGHASTIMTMRVYAHVLEGQTRQSAERLNSLLEGI